MRKGAGIVALVGALVVLASDFGGWYSRDAQQLRETTPSLTGSMVPESWYFWRTSESWESINILTPYAPLLLIVVGLLAWTAYIALRTRSGTLAAPSRLPVWTVPAAGAAITLALGLIFVAAMLIADPNDWWLDAGFYAGLLAGGISAFLLSKGRLTPA